MIQGSVAGASTEFPDSGAPVVVAQRGRPVDDVVVGVVVVVVEVVRRSKMVV
jgi:hypothetical protein